MKFQVGDKVVVRHTGEEAIVAEIINKQMVLLDVGGISFPAYADELEFPFTGVTRFEGMEQLPDLLCDPESLRDGYLKELESYLQDVRQGCARLGTPTRHHIEHARWHTGSQGKFSQTQGAQGRFFAGRSQSGDATLCWLLSPGHPKACAFSQAWFVRSGDNQIPGGG